MQLSQTRTGYVCLVPSAFALVALFHLVGATDLLNGAVLHVPGGAKLQKVLDAAQPGDTITLQPGATYTGPYWLRRKTGNEFITITTSNPGSLPPDGTRITPAYSRFLPQVISPSTSPVFRTDPGAHHYKLIGLEISSPGKYNWDLIRLGTAEASSVANQGANFVLDRLYIHGDPRVGAKRGVTLNSGSTIVKNCYISDIKGIGQETQALLGYNGPGPFEITNNYLEAAGENIMFGASVPKIHGLVPSDITFRRNHFTKKLSWRLGHPLSDGKKWTVKNLFELKSARRVTVEGNIFENNWRQAQSGYAIVLTVRTQNGKMPWAVVEDVTFARNIIRNSGAGVNILGQDYSGGNLGKARRLTFSDNLFENIDYKKFGGDGRLFQLLHAPEDVTIEHNTLVSANVWSAIMFGAPSTVRLVFTNNIIPHGATGIFGSGSYTGTITLSKYTRGYVVSKNAFTGAPGKASSYPAGNYFPAAISNVGFIDLLGGDYRLASSSPYRNAGTDGQDIGANVSLVQSATAGALSQ